MMEGQSIANGAMLGEPPGTLCGASSFPAWVRNPGNLADHPKLLLPDELGYLPLDKRGADLMLRVVASLCELGSIVLSTNCPFGEWGKIFDVDNTLATAMIDRLMHHGEAYVIRGKSYRMKNKDTP